MAYVYAVTPTFIDSIGNPDVPIVAEAFGHALAECDTEI